MTKAARGIRAGKRADKPYGLLITRPWHPQQLLLLLCDVKRSRKLQAMLVDLPF